MPETITAPSNQAPKYTYKLQLAFDADVVDAKVKLTDLAYMTIEKYDQNNNKVVSEIFALGSKYASKLEYSYSSYVGKESNSDKETVYEGLAALKYVIDSGKVTNINIRAASYEELKMKQVEEYNATFSTEQDPEKNLNTKISEVKKFLNDNFKGLSNLSVPKKSVGATTDEGKITVEQIINELTNYMYDADKKPLAPANDQNQGQSVPSKKIIHRN